MGKISTLRVLETSTGPLTAVFLPLFGPRIPSQESSLSKQGAKIFIEFEKGTRNSEAEGSCLPTRSSSLNIGLDPETVHKICRLERPLSPDTIGLPGKVILERSLIDEQILFAFNEPDAGYRFFPSPRRIVSIHQLISKGIGFWALCRCSGPA